MNKQRAFQFISNILVLFVIGTTLFFVTHQIYNFKLNIRVEKTLYQWIYQLKKETPQVDNSIAIIMVDNEDLKSLEDSGLKQFPDLSLSEYYRLINKISLATPEFIYLDFVNGAHPIQSSEYGLFVDQIKKIENLIIGVPFLSQWIPPAFNSLKHVYFMATMTESLDDPMLSYIYYSSKSFSLAYDHVLQRSIEGKNFKEQLIIENPEFKQRLTNNRLWANGNMKGVLINYAPYQKFNIFHAREVLAPDFNLSLLQHKKILIGNNSHFAENDTVINRALTPLQPGKKDLFKHGSPLIFVFANIINTFLTGTEITVVASWWDLILTVGFCLIIIFSWWFWHPLRTLSIYLAFLFSLILADLLLLSFFYSYLPLFIPVYFSTLSLAAGAVLRLIKENLIQWKTRQTHQALEETKDLKVNFISLVSHNLNTPIAKIRNLIELVEYDRQNQLDPGMQSSIAQIIKLTNFLEKYFYNILLLIKVEESAFQITPASKDINELIKKKVNSFQSYLVEKSLRITFAPDPLFPCKLDPNLISNILDNLIDNAVKFSKPQQTIEIKSIDEEDFVKVQICSQGWPVSAEEKESIFDKFYRGANAKEAGEKGMGIGLYLSRYFARLHQGDLVVDIEDGEKTTFSLTIPL